MKSVKEIPTIGEWGDISDLDIHYAYEIFGGKDNSSLQCEFKKNVIERCENLRWMPIIPFQYYVIGFKKYIESNDFGKFDMPDAANCFIELIEEKAITQPEFLEAVYPELKSCIEYLADHQVEYEADLDIYGDFKAKAMNIFAALEKT